MIELRPERRPHVNKVDDKIGAKLVEAFNQVGIIQVGYRDLTIWRWADEPGHWRDEKGRLMADSEIPPGAIPKGEMDQRRLMEDRAAVKEHIAAAMAGASAVEARPGYQMIGKGGLFQVVNSAGEAVTPGTVPEAVAREILAMLSPDPTPGPSLGEAMLMGGTD